MSIVNDALSKLHIRSSLLSNWRTQTTAVQAADFLKSGARLVVIAMSPVLRPQMRPMSRRLSVTICPHNVGTATMESPCARARIDFTNWNTSRLNPTGALWLTSRRTDPESRSDDRLLEARQPPRVAGTQPYRNTNKRKINLWGLLRFKICSVCVCDPIRPRATILLAFH